MSGIFRALFARRDSFRQQIQQINAIRADLAQRSDADLRSYAQRANQRLELMAAAAAAAARVLGQELFDVQLRGALTLTQGRIAEMQTGEGKTLAAVPAAICYAPGRQGAHAMTANDYLARRDAPSTRCISEYFWLSVASMPPEL